MKEKVGFMGLGIMGHAMAVNLAKAGFPVVVYNRTPKDSKALKDLGVQAAPSPKALAEQSDVVIAMLTGPEAIDNLLWGKDGAAEAFHSKKTFVNMSTVSPAYTKGLAQRLAPTGATFIDAPVSGSKKPAEDATLLILAGGDKEKIAALDPVFKAMGKQVVYCGEAGQGSMMKMANNLLLAQLIEGLAETLNFGKKGGLSQEALMDVLLHGPLAAPIFNMKCPVIAAGKYEPAFPLKHATKDLKFVVDTAYEIGAPVPAGLNMLHLFSTGVVKKWGDLDISAIMKVLESLS